MEEILHQLVDGFSNGFQLVQDFLQQYLGYILQDGAPQLWSLVYKLHEYEFLISTKINQRIQPLVSQLNAIFRAPSCSIHW